MKPLNEQINPKIIAQAKMLDQYTRILHKILPIECRNHVQIANIRQQNLMLITDSPVWTTRLRQLCPQILLFLQENKTENEQIIHHIQISTRYQNNSAGEPRTSVKKDRLKPSITEKTANLLSQSANSIGDQRLKEALLRVARNRASTDKQEKKE